MPEPDRDLLAIAVTITVRLLIVSLALWGIVAAWRGILG